MGFDTSFHPVNESLIRDRLVPYIMGGRGIDDLVAAAVEREKVRFRAKAFALGLLDAANTSEADSAKAAPTAKGKTGWLAGVFGFKSSRERNAALDLKWFDSELHVWGRPFLIVADDLKEVANHIDRYLAIAPSAVDRLAIELIHRRAAGLAVTPDHDNTLPDNESLAQQVRWKIDLFREAFANLASGQPVSDPDGNEHIPSELLSRDLPLSTMEFAARFTPGWMARGKTWPTLILPEAGIEVEMFTTPSPLFGDLIDAVPELEDALQSTIVENYSLGGYVTACRVKEFAALIDSNIEHLKSYAGKAGWQDSGAVTFRKLREAVDYAARKNFGFVEATEIYSGPCGIMN